MAANDPVSLLRAALEEEHAALITGRLDGLDALAARKAQLSVMVRGAGAADLDHLRAMAARNGALMQAARAGLSAAVERLGLLRGGRAELSTYDRQGRHRLIGQVARRIEKRA